MARQPMTDEQRKAFGEKMKALRLAKQTPRDPLDTPHSVEVRDIPQPAITQEDPRIAAKLTELDEALRRTNELNAHIEAQEKIRSEAFKVGKPISDEEKQTVIQSQESDIEIIKAKLKAQPKIRIYVPLEGKEKPGTQLPVTINGYRVNVPKGLYVDVPEQIATIVTDSLNQTAAAIDNPLRLDLDEKKADILA